MTIRRCIETESVLKDFGKQTVLNDISLSVDYGDVFGILGPSGSGKTTLIRILCGMLKPTRGHVRVLGTRMPNLDSFRRIGYMSQADALYGDLNAVENLEFFASLQSLTKKTMRRRIGEVLELMSLTQDIKKPVSQYSGGMKRRLSLAAALVHQPELLFLDEPTVGMDPLLRKAIWQELMSLRDHGTTVLMTTHVMEEAAKCRHLCMLREGRLIAVDTPEALMVQSNTNNLEDAFTVYGGEAK